MGTHPRDWIRANNLCFERVNGVAEAQAMNKVLELVSNVGGGFLHANWTCLFDEQIVGGGISQLAVVRLHLDNTVFRCIAAIVAGIRCILLVRFLQIVGRCDREHFVLFGCDADADAFVIGK